MGVAVTGCCCCWALTKVDAADDIEQTCCVGECASEVGDGMDTEGDEDEVQMPESCIDEALTHATPRPVAAAAAASCNMLLLLLDFALML